jgi:hypothetical protein
MTNVGVMMTKETLTVDLPADLYHEFIDVITEKNGCWREDEIPKDAIDTAVAAALTIFIRGLGGKEKLVELQDSLLKTMTGKHPETKTDGWN